MTVVRRVVESPAPAAGAERLWYQVDQWPAWVDGFQRLVECHGDWPDSGARLVWESTPYGRGRVTETVLEYTPGAGQAVAVEDDRLRGTQRVFFEPLEDGVAITLDLDYRLRKRNPLMLVVDLLFVRRALGDSLRRTLERFAGELARI